MDASQVDCLIAWRLEVQGQGAGRERSCQTCPLSLVDGCLCLHMAFPLHLSVVAFPLFLQGCQPYWIKAYPNDLMLMTLILRPLFPHNTKNLFRFFHNVYECPTILANPVHLEGCYGEAVRGPNLEDTCPVYTLRPSPPAVCRAIFLLEPWCAPHRTRALSPAWLIRQLWVS